MIILGQCQHQGMRLAVCVAFGIVTFLPVATPAAQSLHEVDQERTLVRRTTLIVADIDKSIDFYRDVLGFSRWYFNEGTVSEGSIPSAARVGDPSHFAIMKGKDPWIGMVGLLQKGHAVELEIRPQDFGVRPGDTILMLETDDLASIYRRMLDAETPIWKAPETTVVTGAGGRRWKATFLFAFDPDGHLLEINQPHFDEPVEPSSIRCDYADTRTGQLHFHFTAEQRQIPLVLLHQSPLSGRMYKRLMPLLAGTRQVLAPDTPGYGESDLPAAYPEVADYTDALIDWLDAVNIERVDLFGYHTGSVVAVDLAVRFPRRVRSVILMSVPLFSAQEMQQWKLQPPEFEEDGTHLISMWNSSYSNRAPRQTLAMVAATVAEKQRAGQNDWWALRALSQYSLGDRLRQLDEPVLLINPGDGLFKRTREVTKLLPDAQYMEKEEWGYGIFDTEAPQIARMIESYLNDRDAESHLN